MAATAALTGLHRGHHWPQSRRGTETAAQGGPLACQLGRLPAARLTARKMRAKPAGRMPALRQFVRWEEAFGGTPNATRGRHKLPMIVRQSLGDFSRGKECAIGLYYPFFLMISQQKPGKVIFHGKSGSARCFQPLSELCAGQLGRNCSALAKPCRYCELLNLNWTNHAATNSRAWVISR